MPPLTFVWPWVVVSLCEPHFPCGRGLLGDARSQEVRNASVNRGVPNPGERLLPLPMEADTGCFDLCATQEYTGFLWLLTWRASS